MKEMNEKNEIYEMNETRIKHHAGLYEHQWIFSLSSTLPVYILTAFLTSFFF